MNKHDFQKKVKITDNQSGGCLKGHLNISYGEIVDLLGEPNVSCDENKTDAEWAVSFKEKTFAIYNWKNGHNYCGEFGIDTEDITKWNIGGENKELADKLIKLIESVN